MFTTKGLFSEISCPYQDTCVLPRCIFAHPKGLLDPLTTAPETQNSNVAEDEHDQGGPRKRQKVAVENEWPGSASATPSKIEDKTSELTRERNVLEPKSKQMSSLTRPVSPPLSRNKTQDSSAKKSPLSGGKVSVSKINSDKECATLKADTEKVTPTETPLKRILKKESLNPRPLKVNPATHQIRYKLIQALHEQLKRLNSELEKDANDAEEELLLSEQAVITTALDIEEAAARNPSIYSNTVKNKIVFYKKMSVKTWKEEREKEIAKEKAREVASSSNTPAAKPKGPPIVIETGLKIEEEIMLLPRLYTPITGLSKHGYVTSIPTDEEINTAKKGVEAAKGWEVCDRCKNRFQVFPGRREEDGALASGGKCTYHFGKPYFPERSALDPKGKKEKRYRCCGEAIGDSAGCTKGDCHVFKISEVKRLAAVLNFEKTPENPSKVLGNPVCIDGEMGYTVYGLELIRLTATSWPSGSPLFDVLVRPVGEILDLNSRYSGISPKDMAEAKPFSTSSPASSEGPLQIVSSPAAAKALLFSHLSPSTPLIGHGLENDLNATRLIHPTIIDTALLFPHKAGLPYRNALKTLMSTHLNKDIQKQTIVDGKMEGHDSKEDANAAGELVRMKVRDLWTTMKKAGWAVESGGVFVPPDGSEEGIERREGDLGTGAGQKRGWNDDTSA